jgi:transposase
MTGGLRDDRKEPFQEIVMSKKSKRPRRSFSDEFKQDAVDLVVKQNYSFKAAAEAVGVSSRSLREWHEKRAPEPVPCDDDASADLLREEIKQLKKRLLRVEMERDILKKATARHRRFEAPAELSRGSLSAASSVTGRLGQRQF